MQRRYDDRATDQIVTGAGVDAPVAHLALREVPHGKRPEITDSLAVGVQISGGHAAQEPTLGIASILRRLRRHPARVVHVRTESVNRRVRGAIPTVMSDQIAERILPQLHAGASLQKVGNRRAHLRFMERRGRTRQDGVNDVQYPFLVHGGD